MRSGDGGSVHGRLPLVWSAARSRVSSTLFLTLSGESPASWSEQVEERITALEQRFLAINVLQHAMNTIEIQRNSLDVLWNSIRQMRTSEAAPVVQHGGAQSACEHDVGKKSSRSSRTPS